MNPPDSSDDYKQMILEKLGNDLPRDTCDNLLPGKSIFDLFATAYNGPETTIRLREHFRCLPEIIGFSNELCYDNCLIPMRESRPGFGLAIQMKFVEGGSSTVIKPVNLEEAKMIVKQVKVLLQEDDCKEYKRTIGIISLWHPNQAKVIDGLLDEDDYISARRHLHGPIRCADARGFQGGERDIILLSMVIGAGENRKVSEDEAGFNVAVSRARYSVILFHSVKLGGLKDGDVRKTLLKYFQKFCDPSPNFKHSVWGEFKYLISFTNQLEGYMVKPINIKNQAFMIQVGSNCCEKSCVFVFLGAFPEWEKEQEICYMLSRLERSWKAVWLFDAIVRPKECLTEMKTFLMDKKVAAAIFPSPAKRPTPTQSAVEERSKRPCSSNTHTRPPLSDGESEDDNQGGGGQSGGGSSITGAVDDRKKEIASKSTRVTSGLTPLTPEKQSQHAESPLSWESTSADKVVAETVADVGTKRAATVEHAAIRAQKISKTEAEGGVHTSPLFVHTSSALSQKSPIIFEKCLVIAAAPGASATTGVAIADDCEPTPSAASENEGTSTKPRMPVRLAQDAQGQNSALVGQQHELAGSIHGGAQRAEGVSGLPEAGGTDVGFSSQQLARVLLAAFTTKVAMKHVVQGLKAKSDLFKTVQLSCKADGGTYSNEQIAVKIAVCRSDAVGDAKELLLWLTDNKVLMEDHLKVALDKFGIKYKVADTLEVLSNSIVEDIPMAPVVATSERHNSANSQNPDEKHGSVAESISGEASVKVSIARVQDDDASQDSLCDLGQAIALLNASKHLDSEMPCAARTAPVSAPQSPILVAAGSKKGHWESNQDCAFDLGQAIAALNDSKHLESDVGSRVSDGHVVATSETHTATHAAAHNAAHIVAPSETVVSVARRAPSTSESHSMTHTARHTATHIVAPSATTVSVARRALSTSESTVLGTSNADTTNTTVNPAKKSATETALCAADAIRAHALQLPPHAATNTTVDLTRQDTGATDTNGQHSSASSSNGATSANGANRQQGVASSKRLSHEARLNCDGKRACTGDGIEREDDRVVELNDPMNEDGNNVALNGRSHASLPSTPRSTTASCSTAAVCSTADKRDAPADTNASVGLFGLPSESQCNIVAACSTAAEQATHHNNNGGGAVSLRAPAAWGRLEFLQSVEIGGGAVLLKTAQGVPFVMGQRGVGCDYEAVDEHISSAGGKGSRVSRSHCNIRLIQGQGHVAAELQDTSTSGTWLNGTKMTKNAAYSLTSGDYIQLVNDVAQGCPDHLAFNFYFTVSALGAQD